MKHRATAHRPRRSVWSARTTASACWTAAAVAAVAAWCGCTVTPSNYKTLSFFFDGVKDPSAVSADGGVPGDTTIALAVVVHTPYAEEKCETCHKSSYRPSRNDPSACLSCHDTIMDQHQWTHGAVAGGACLWCHSPHESARKWLLRGPDRKLCAQCHAPTMESGSSVPAHADPTINCTSCHYGHGGQSSLMLKPGATATTLAAPEPEKPRPERPRMDLPPVLPASEQHPVPSPDEVGPVAPDQAQPESPLPGPAT